MPAVLSNTDIIELLERNGIHLVFINYKDQLEETPIQVGSYVVNMADSDDGSGGTHWVAFIIEKIDSVYHTVYFDAFGLAPSEAVKQYLAPIDDDIVYNWNQIQNENSSICGWFVVYWIWFMNTMKNAEPNIYLRYKKFLNLFSSREEDNRKLLQQYLKGMI